MVYTAEEVARVCDHTNLAMDAPPEAIAELCSFAKRYQTASVCVRPGAVPYAKELLTSSGVAVCTVVGFPDGKWADGAYLPNGYPSTREKVLETGLAVAQGATEIDVVANLEFALTGKMGQFQDDLRAVVDVAHEAGASVKVIFENCLVGGGLKSQLYEQAVLAGADFLKTSTGYGFSGSNPEDLWLMRSVAPAHVGVKAAGGVNPQNYLDHTYAALGRNPEDPKIPLDSKLIRIGESSLLKKLAR